MWIEFNNKVDMLVHVPFPGLPNDMVENIPRRIIDYCKEFRSFTASLNGDNAMPRVARESTANRNVKQSLVPNVVSANVVVTKTGR